MKLWPNQSPEPLTWMGAAVLRLSVLFYHVTVPTWLSFFRWPMKRVTRCVSMLFIAILACSCALSHRHQHTITVSPKADLRDQYSSAAWLAYGMALCRFEGSRSKPDAFEEEVYARTAAANVWMELKGKQTVNPNSGLDALAAVQASGFMREVRLVLSEA